MNRLTKFKCFALLFASTLGISTPAYAGPNEGWTDILDRQEAIGRFDWLESCHKYILVDMWDRISGQLDTPEAEKIRLLKAMLQEKNGAASQFPQYLTFGKKDYTNPNAWYAGTSNKQPCKALPPTYKALGTITSFDLPKYCVNKPNYAGIISVDTVTIAGQTHKSGFGGYTNQFSKVFTVKRNSNIPYSLNAGYLDQSAGVASWKMWIDYNRDGDFADAGELILNEYSDPLTSQFKVPANAQPGYTKLRVQAAYSGGTDDPCGSFFAGEIEDFVLHVE